MRYKYLGLYIALLLTYTIQAQTPATAPKRILVLGLKTSQFNSNVYYINELAFLNDTAQSKVIDLYNQTLLQTLTEYPSTQYQFILPTSIEIAAIQRRSNYVEWKNEYKEPYLALDADSVQDVQFAQLIGIYSADYVLNLNYYNIFRNSPPAFYSSTIKTRHIIDYELFNSQLGIASAGQITLISTNSKATAMKPKYTDFAAQLIERLQIVEGNFPTAVAEKKYLRLRERIIKDAWGAGFSLGWGNTYGWFSTQLLRNIGTQWDINGGIGFGPSGFKAGAGVRYFLLNYGRKYKPFFEVNYAWASGMKIDMGGEKDDSGTQLYPDRVSTFRIPSDQAIHLKTGFRWLKNSKAWMLHVGYAMPFKGDKARIIAAGSDVSVETFNRRKNWADLFTVGGVDVGITYLIYFQR
jgi:hypothetical protein